MKTPSTRAVLAIATAFLLVAGSAMARQEGGRHGYPDGHRGPPDAETRVARMTQALDLTDEQSARLLVVMQDLDSERRVLHDQVMEQMKPELCDLQSRTEIEIADILTPEQQVLAEELKAERPGKGSRRGRRGPEGLDCSEFE